MRAPRLVWFALHGHRQGSAAAASSAGPEFRFSSEPCCFRAGNTPQTWMQVAFGKPLQMCSRFPCPA